MKLMSYFVNISIAIVTSGSMSVHFRVIDSAYDNLMSTVISSLRSATSDTSLTSFHAAVIAFQEDALANCDAATVVTCDPQFDVSAASRAFGKDCSDGV